MKIGYNDYSNFDDLAAGAALYYQEIKQLLEKQKVFKTLKFNFYNVIRNQMTPSLSKGDVLIANSGPYSWLYYHIREKSNRKYSIIHDIQTSLFSDYIIQQQLCNDLMREGDKVLFLSEFQRQLYIKMFPDYLNDSNCFVCNPLLSFFPEKGIKSEKKNGMVVGWLGRVSKEKNFDQALNVFINAYKEIRDIDIKMIVAGKADSEYLPKIVQGKLEKEGIPKEKYFHVNNGKFIDRKSIWDILRKMDVLLFPSTANIESLGRVIVEANHAGIPVIASNHGACSEVLSQESLVSVEYLDEPIEITRCVPLGRVDDYEMLDKIADYKGIPLGNNHEYLGHDKKLISIIAGESKKEKGIKISKQTSKFINACNITLNSGYSLSNEEARKKAILILKQYSGHNHMTLTKPSNDLFARLDFHPILRISKEKYPRLIVTEVTRRCNRNCVMCYNYKNQNQQDNLSTKDLLDFLRQAKENRAEIISLTGGEPLLRKDLPKIIRVISDLNMTSVVFTNGDLINESLGRKILLSGLSRLFFSLDSSEEAINDYLRGKGAFKRTVDSIRLMLDIRKETKAKTELRVGTTITNLNISNIPELVEFCRHLGVDGITFKPVRVHNGIVEGNAIRVIKRNDIKADELWIKEDKYEVLDKVIDYLVGYNKKSGFIWDKPAYLRLIKRYFRNPNNDYLGIECHSGNSFFVLDKDGNILPCWGVDWGAMGNIKDKELEKVWDSTEYDETRKRMKRCPLPCYNLIINKTYLR